MSSSPSSPWHQWISNLIWSRRLQTLRPISRNDQVTFGVRFPSPRKPWLSNLRHEYARTQRPRRLVARATTERAECVGAGPDDARRDDGPAANNRQCRAVRRYAVANEDVSRSRRGSTDVRVKVCSMPCPRRIRDLFGPDLSCGDRGAHRENLGFNPTLWLRPRNRRRGNANRKGCQTGFGVLALCGKNAAQDAE